MIDILLPHTTIDHVYDNYQRDSRSHRSPYRSSYRSPYNRDSRPDTNLDLTPEKMTSKNPLLHIDLLQDL